MALEPGTILVAKNYIKCYVPSYQYEVGTEFCYLFSYQGCYIVQRCHNGKVYDGDDLLPKYSGEAGCLLAVKPCDVEVKKENKKSKSTKKSAKKPDTNIIAEYPRTMEKMVRELVREEVMNHLKVNLSIWSEGGNSADIEWLEKGRKG